MTILCHIDDIPEGESRGIQSHNSNLFAVKKEGHLYLYYNSCPHLGIELEWEADKFLDADGVLIQCSTHGALFEIASGECIAGPCVSEHLTPVAFRMAEDGSVLLES